LTTIAQPLSAAEEALDELGTDVTVCVIRVDEERKRNDGVDTNTHGTLEVVTLSVLDEVVNDQNRDEEDNGLEALEVQGHRLVHDPAKKYEEGSDEKRDLHGGSDGHVDSEIHFALVCDDDSGDVLGGVSNNGNEDETDKSLADMCGFDDGVNAVNEELSADGDHDGDQDKRNTGSDGRQDLALLLLVLSALVLDIGEQVVVRVQLEIEVQDVENEQDDGGAVREDENVLIGLGVVGVAVLHDCVECGRDDERGRGDSHERGHGRCDGLVEALFLLANATSEETASEHLVESEWCYETCDWLRLTSRMLDRMLPSMLDWTIRISPSLRATIETWKCQWDSRRIAAHTHNQLDGISKGRIHQTTKSLAQLCGQLLSRKAQQSSKRDNSDEV
jgi:hypothetical protein